MEAEDENIICFGVAFINSSILLFEAFITILLEDVPPGVEVGLPQESKMELVVNFLEK